jgi:Zn-dependent protease
MIEALGYLAMTLTMLSFAFSDMRTLRGVNVLACLIWIIYGLLMSSEPIIFTNVAIGSVHIFSIYKNKFKS